MSRFSDFIQSLPFVTQSAHFFAGISIVLATARFCNDAHPWGVWTEIAGGLLVLFVWTVPKELLYDWQPWGEGHGSPDWLDLLFYWLGGTAACSLLYFTYR